MTSYVAITEAETDPDAPLTSVLVKKLRDNALAIQEGDTTAIAAGKRILPTAITDLVGNNRITHTNTTPVVVQLPYNGTWLACDFYALNGSAGSAGNLRVRVSTNGGTTWTTHFNIQPLAANQEMWGRFFLNRTTGFIDRRSGVTNQISESTFTITGTINAIEFSIDTAGSRGSHYLTYLGAAG